MNITDSSYETLTALERYFINLKYNCFQTPKIFKDSNLLYFIFLSTFEDFNFLKNFYNIILNERK